MCGWTKIDTQRSRLVTLFFAHECTVFIIIMIIVGRGNSVRGIERIPDQIRVE